MWRRASLVLVGLSLTACAAATQTSRRPAFVVAGRDVITAAEIVAARVTDAYQAVLELRPEFLRRRGASIPSYARKPVVVYLDEMPWGTAESLRHIPLERVRLIRYISPMEADLRWGTGHSSGAILVTTMK